MIRNSYLLRLTMQAPVLTHAAGSLDLGVDAAMQRYRGQPVLNGSLVRGNLRHLLLGFTADLGRGDIRMVDAIEPIQTADVTDWLGPDPDRNDSEPQIAALTFDLFWRLEPDSCAGLDQDATGQPVRHRIELGDSDTVASGQLQVVESPFPVGAEPVFSGRIRARFPSEAARRHCEHWLGKALALLPALGAQKGVGFGRVLRGELERVEPLTASAADSIQADRLGARFGMLLYLDRPFSIARTAQFQPQGNRLLHDDQIPGSALKAVIARAHGGGSLSLQQDLDFDRIAVTAALPAPRTAPGRPLPLPSSLAVYDDGNRKRVIDLALQAAPCLIETGDGPAAPAFRPDWKKADQKAAEDAFGQPPARPEHLLLVRTAIDPAARVADEAKLFALECTDVPEHCWCADIDLHRVHPADPDARLAVTETLAALLADGLPDLGKTRAVARAALRERPFTEIRAPEPLGSALTLDGRDTWLVLLRSAARLLPARIEAVAISGTNGGDRLHEAYAAYWTQVSEGDLALSHYYAQQEAVGGEYYWRHFRNREDHYRPEWLTLPGSVFVVTSAPEQRDAVQKKLAEWLCIGLPQAADRARDDDWRTNPYLGENGYGEIAVNAAAQLRLIPKPDDRRLMPLAEATP